MLKPSDIVQIPFPFFDLANQKRCPVLLLTAPDAFGDFLVAAVNQALLGLLEIAKSANVKPRVARK